MNHHHNSSSIGSGDYSSSNNHTFDDPVTVAASFLVGIREQPTNSSDASRVLLRASSMTLLQLATECRTKEIPLAVQFVFANSLYTQQLRHPRNFSVEEGATLFDLIFGILDARLAASSHDPVAVQLSSTLCVLALRLHVAGARDLSSFIHSLCSCPEKARQSAMFILTDLANQLQNPRLSIRPEHKAFLREIMQANWDQVKTVLLMSIASSSSPPPPPLSSSSSTYPLLMSLRLLQAWWSLPILPALSFFNDDPAASTFFMQCLLRSGDTIGIGAIEAIAALFDSIASVMPVPFLLVKCLEHEFANNLGSLGHDSLERAARFAVLCMSHDVSFVLSAQYHQLVESNLTTMIRILETCDTSSDEAVAAAVVDLWQAVSGAIEDLSKDVADKALQLLLPYAQRCCIVSHHRITTVLSTNRYSFEDVFELAQNARELLSILNALGGTFQQIVLHCSSPSPTNDTAVAAWMLMAAVALEVTSLEDNPPVNCHPDVAIIEACNRIVRCIEKQDLMSTADMCALKFLRKLSSSSMLQLASSDSIQTIERCSMSLILHCRGPEAARVDAAVILGALYRNQYPCAHSQQTLAQVLIVAAGNVTEWEGLAAGAAALLSSTTDAAAAHQLSAFLADSCLDLDNPSVQRVRAVTLWWRCLCKYDSLLPLVAAEFNRCIPVIEKLMLKAVSGKMVNLAEMTSKLISSTIGCLKHHCSVETTSRIAQGALNVAVVFDYGPMLDPVMSTCIKSVAKNDGVHASESKTSIIEMAITMLFRDLKSMDHYQLHLQAPSYVIPWCGLTGALIEALPSTIARFVPNIMRQLVSALFTQDRRQGQAICKVLKEITSSSCGEVKKTLMEQGEGEGLMLVQSLLHAAAGGMPSFMLADIVSVAMCTKSNLQKMFPIWLSKALGDPNCPKPGIKDKVKAEIYPVLVDSKTDPSHFKKFWKQLCGGKRKTT